MSDEEYRITETGIEEAIEILERGGYLPDATEDEDIDTLLLKDACAKYISASNAKGDSRTEQECQDALVVAFFEAHLEARTRWIVN